MNIFKQWSLITYVTLCIFHSQAYSQENADKTDDISQATTIVKNNINVELLGRALNGYSLNYLHVFKDYEKSYLSYSIGASYFSLNHNTNRTSIPLSIYYTSHKTSNFHGEYGLGVSYMFDSKKDEDNHTEENLSRASIHASVGIKYQKPSGGFNAKLSLTPTKRFYKTDDFLDLEPLVHLIGVTVGYAF